MGFYGHITNLQKTSMTFDRIYSNRFAMDSMATKDGVYAGRYVLVEYSNPLDSTLLSGVMQFDGMLYAIPAQRDPKEWEGDKNIPENYLEKLQPLKVNREASSNILNGYIKTNITVVCSTDYNLGVVQNEEGDKRIVPISRKQYFKIANDDTTKMSYILFYNHKERRFELTDKAEQEEKTGCSYLEIQYSSITTDSEAADANYLVNFNIDLDNYNTARGYDSTVWQKTYADGKAKYVMIAELNSVVPILDISADAPTLAPIMPHFDEDSTNIYYKLHMQPSWGFRIKGANPNLKIPTLDYSGSVVTDGSSGDIEATTDILEYPSDQTTRWINTIYKNNNYTNEYLHESSTDNSSAWENTPSSIDGAIYFNRAGFDREYINYSQDYPYKNRDLTLNPVVDEITLTPTGRSGHLYPTHTTDGKNTVQNDVNELAVLLPSIGDTVAGIWNVIYGGVDVSKEEVIDGRTKYKRNTIIQWEDAKKVLAKEGLRLVKSQTSESNRGTFTYDTKAVNSIAGVLNSVQDIMGMIIADYNPMDNIDKLNEDYIYYYQGKYYYKKPTYTYEKVEGEVDYEVVDLKNWEDYKDKAWWIDTNYIIPDYMMEEEFKVDREYVQGVKVPDSKAGDEGEPRKFEGSEYEPGKYYLFQEWENVEQKLPFKDSTTQAPYHKYVKSNDKEQNQNLTYYALTLTPKTLKKNSVFYMPNKYYAGYFVKIDPAKLDTQEKFDQYLADGVRLFKSKTKGGNDDYGIISGEEVFSKDYEALVNSKDIEQIYYLTLRSCQMDAATYAEQARLGQAPMLFADELSSSKDTQNYYIMIEKYELFTDKKTLASAPGIYYYLEKKGEPDSTYLDKNNFLLPKYYKNLELEEDIVYNEDCLYFRRIVELTLNSASNIIDIKTAKHVIPDIFPDNLYKYYEEGAEQGYKSISVLSQEVFQCKDYSTITGLYELSRTPLTTGYKAGEWYYQEVEGPYAGSVILDTKTSATKDRPYWGINMINKILLTDAERAKGPQADEVYYKFDASENDYVKHSGKFEAGVKYYKSSLIDAPEIYAPNKYYYKNNNGDFVLDLSPDFTPGREYYRNPQVYILNDPNGFYDKGSLWPIAQNPPANSGIELATRTDAWELEELVGFDTNFNTLHGLLLRLNKWMLQNDKLTRDEETLQGALNTLNDLIHRFGQMKPGQLMMVDNTGRMHGTNYTTAQAFSAVNYGGYEDYEIESTEAAANNEDTWIDIDTVDDYKDPRIIVKHNFTKVKDTTSVSDNNVSVSDTIDLYAPIVDSRGHVVGHNTETVTLPYGFKKVTLMNSSLNTHSPSNLEVVIEDKVTANNTQDTLIFKAGNEWIKFDATSGSADDIIHVYHQTEDTRQAVTKNTDLNDGSATIGPILQTFTRDRGGHVNDLVPVSYTLPNGYSKFKSGETEVSDAQNTMDVFVFKGDDWLKPTVAQGELTYTHINNHATLASGTHSLGAQTPAFGDTFNLQAYVLDANGHVINKNVETVTLPTDINPLVVPTFDDTDSMFVKSKMTLLGALTNLDMGLRVFSTSLMQKDMEIQDSINDLATEMTTADNQLASDLEDLDTSTKEAIEEIQQSIATNMATIEDTYAPLEGNVDSATLFEYSPEVEEVSHEATEADVVAGLAAAVGDKVIDVEATPAENLTIQQLFAKVKELETLIAQGA